MSRVFQFLTLALVLSGCNDPYGQAQKNDTIEGYEAFIRDNPQSAQIDMAGMRLEQLVLEKARMGKSLEGYDAYLERYPKGRFQETALNERRDFLFEWAAQANTVAAWQKYLDEYRKGDKKMRIQAKKRLYMAEHADNVQLGSIKMEQVNLAEDPEGPLNGYGFYVDVTNKGNKKIVSLNLEIAYLGANGKALARKRWPVVAPRLPGGMPFAAGFDKPMAPGDVRTWEWTDGKIPSAWAKKVTVKPVAIRFPGPR